MQHWRRHATLHTAPTRVLEPGQDGASLYYSRRLMPIATHPLLEGLAPSATRGLLTHQLDAHLEFTAHLEHRVVTQVAWSIGNGRLLPWLPVGYRLDANKIYVDEAYHSMAATGFISQVEHSSA